MIRFFAVKTNIWIKNTCVKFNLNICYSTDTIYMLTDNTIYTINKNNSAEMDRNVSKPYRVPLQFPLLHVQGTLFCYFGKRTT